MTENPGPAIVGGVVRGLAAGGILSVAALGLVPVRSAAIVLAAAAPLVTAALTVADEIPAPTPRSDAIFLGGLIACVLACVPFLSPLAFWSGRRPTLVPPFADAAGVLLMATAVGLAVGAMLEMADRFVRPGRWALTFRLLVAAAMIGGILDLLLLVQALAGEHSLNTTRIVTPLLFPTGSALALGLPTALTYPLVERTRRWLEPPAA